MTDAPSPTFTRTGRVDDELDAGPDELEQPAPRRVVDPDLEPSVGRSSLDELRDQLEAELADDVENPPLELAVPGRPGYVIRYATAIEYDQIVAWEKRCMIGKGANRHVHALRLARIVLAATCEQIVRNGDELVSAGEPLTFRSEALHELLGVDRAADAVQRLYGRDTDVTRAAGKVLEAAGYVGEGDELDDEWSAEAPRTPLDVR